MKYSYTHVCHTFPAEYTPDSQILILGSFPSVRSRQTMFYYGHPQNRFWNVLAAVFHTPVPMSIEEKKIFLASHRIALYDVLEECDITGSADASIKHPVPADLTGILAHTRIQRIYVNGKTAYTLYNRYEKPVLNRDAIPLPSTSSANAGWSMDRLAAAWSVIIQ